MNNRDMKENTINDTIPIVVKVEPHNDYTVTVTFDDGTVCVYDMKVYMMLAKNQEMIRPLKDINFFMERCCILNNTLAWDIAGGKDPTKCLDIDPLTIQNKWFVTELVNELLSERDDNTPDMSSMDEKTEDEYDLEAYNKAMEEYKKDPTTYTLDEVERELIISGEQLNQKTINAMNDVLEGKNLSKAYNSVEELTNDLNGEGTGLIQIAYDVMSHNKELQNEPFVGFFWYDPESDELYGVTKTMVIDAVSKHSVLLNEEIKTVRLSQKEVWDRNRKRNKDARFSGDYNCSLKGRVVITCGDKIKVITGSWINDYPEVKNEIQYEFQLPDNCEFLIENDEKERLFIC